MFCKKGVLRNFTKFPGKHRYQSLFFCKSHLFLRPATLLKQALAQVFFCEFCEIFKNALSYRTPPVAASEWGNTYMIKTQNMMLKIYVMNFPSSSSQLICHQVSNQLMYRSSHRWCSLDLQYYQKRPQHRHFPVNIAKFLRTPISKNICKRLLLIVVIYCTKNWAKLFRNQIGLLSHFQT